MTVKQELNQLLYKQQEESYSHISIEEEFAFTAILQTETWMCCKETF